MNKVKLLVDGWEYRGWESVTIEVELQSFSRTFSLTLSIT